METIDTSGRGTSGRCWQTELDPSPCAAKRSADVGAPHSPPQAYSSTRTARPARPEQTKSARSSRQFSRFCYAKNPDKVFGTQIDAGRIERVVAGDDLQGDRAVLYRPRQRAAMVERGRK